MAKRRANGEGNIRKRKDGRWEGRYTAGHDPETGKTIYKNVLGRTQAEVKEKLKKAIEKGSALDPTKAGQYTVGQWLDTWLEDYAKLSIRPSSHKTYRADSLSGNALQAMSWAVGQKIVTGKTGSVLDPDGTATRAEVAVMIMRFCEAG